MERKIDHQGIEVELVSHDLGKYLRLRPRPLKTVLYA
jgi:hypothetical protein